MLRGGPTSVSKTHAGNAIKLADNPELVEMEDLRLGRRRWSLGRCGGGGGCGGLMLEKMVKWKCV